jgi:RHS repeat-associated protein
VCLRHDALGRLTLAARLALNALGSAYYCEIDTYLSTVYGKFKYDARNRRVARFEPSTGRWTYVVSDAAGNPLSEIALVNGAWVPVRDHVWLDGRPLAQIEYPAGGGADRYYHHVDHLGLPRALTNAAGQVVWSATPARPYGDVTETATPDPLTGRTVVTNLRLPGQYDERLLGSLGLQGPYYNWNRWYLPGMGRYLELDPIALRGGFNGEWGVEWYEYAGGNPLSFTDRAGRQSCPALSTCQGCTWVGETFVCPGKGVPPFVPIPIPVDKDGLPIAPDIDTTETIDVAPKQPERPPLGQDCAEEYRLCRAACRGICAATGESNANCQAKCLAAFLACSLGML